MERIRPARPRSRAPGNAIRTWLMRGVVAAGCVLLAGCLQAERALLDEDLKLPQAKLHSLHKSCSQPDVCMVGWIDRVGQRLLGYWIGDARDMRSIAFHRLDDANFVVQTAATDGSAASYLLLRRTATGYRAFDVEIQSMNTAYVAERLRDGHVVDVSTELGRKVGLLSYRVSSRAGLLRVMDDIRGLPDAELASFAKPFDVAALSNAETSALLREQAGGKSRFALEKASAPDLQIPRAGRGETGCPALLPSGVSCSVYAGTPPDPTPVLGRPEVIYLEKYGCNACETMAPWVASWQLARQDVDFFYSYVATWKEPVVSVYNPSRVPAFVVNRRYLVEVKSPDRSSAEYAMGLVAKLAAEAPRGPVRPALQMR